ncbi:[LysW]-aminoadipate kinase [Litorilinea aerophila]|uniref:Putative [LysW]-aminoadipate kinase n=1 Tax=Litorilinea aerophila TaxID=1204385 RepID=A0A540VGX4_9CHLR|nr:[LysW]-aminoadipate kinase [Litorilinea aerophila]MCC9076406.1 [LysW]-aminoadipate kinase [Litorilinea aerophila]OUC06352.1 acetylglutamate kinase [Litorilinea aerophila]GIV79109.1 MAG: putative acetylglutamate kinase-like protein [Litorilinea sp.]
MIVIKVGGGKDLNVDAIVADVVQLLGEGQELLLVHGGAETTNEVAEALGHPPQFVTSESGFVSRRTDRRTLEIFEMVYCGQLNKMWVEKFQRLGVNAVGLSGLDGRIFEGTRKDTLRVRINGRRLVLRDDWTGTVERINTGLLRLLLDNGYFPILTPPGASDQGEAINVDGDRAAAMVAAAFNAEALVILSNVPGLLRNFPDESSLIPSIPRARAGEFMQFAEGRMKKKVMGAVEAIEAGVQKVIFADGRVDRPVSAALAGGGTHIS